MTVVSSQIITIRVRKLFLRRVYNLGDALDSSGVNFGDDRVLASATF